MENIKAGTASADNLQVTAADFRHAMRDVTPAFGASAELSDCLSGGILEYGGELPQLIETTKSLLQQLDSSANTSLLSVLFEGTAGAGKTALAASMAQKSSFPYIKLITPNTLLGMNEMAKAAHISKVFHDAHRSTRSVVVLDDLERLIEYVRIGPRFSNVVLQTLLTCIKKVPSKKDTKLLILGTSSSAEVLTSLELFDAFNFKLSVPTLHPNSVLCVLSLLRVTNAAELQPILSSISEGVPIKKLLLVLEMSLNSELRVDPARFAETLQHAGILA